MAIILEDFQEDCLKNLKNGKVLAAGVGAGKSIMSITWYLRSTCNTKTSAANNGGTNYQILSGSPDLYIITTPKKRDSYEWDDELSKFALHSGKNKEMSNVNIVIDSWNNISHYSEIKNSVFIFDEQRAIGNGSWSKAFIKIAEKNRWIMLSATPGDTWTDWCPIMIADGFYRNRTEFFRRHAVYSRYSKYPKIDRWLDTEHLERCRAAILVTCVVPRKTTRHQTDIICEYDKKRVKNIMKTRFNPDKNAPFTNASELCAYIRRIINNDPTRLSEAVKIVNRHKRVIIFYTLKSELEGILRITEETGIKVYQYNGAVHDPVPDCEEWVYAVQYYAGSEGWNCITSNAIVYWDMPYSYKKYEQAAGRIDRLNTKYSDLYYYRMRSYADIDLGILRALNNKKDFNIRGFLMSYGRKKR